MALNSSYMDDINGQSDPTIPKKNRIGSLATGAINGANDPTQSVYAQKPPQSIADSSYTNPNAPAPGTTAQTSLPSPAGNTGVALGRSIAAGTNVLGDALNRGIAGATDIATLPFRYAANVAGNIYSGLNGEPGTPFNPTSSSDAYAANSMGPPKPTAPPQNAISSIPDYVVKSMFNPTAADVAAAGAFRNPSGSTLPGAAGAMASAIPAVAAGGPTTQPNGASSFGDRAISAGGVKQPDGSYAFSNMPGKPGYANSLENYGDNTNTVSPATGQASGIGVIPNFNNAVNDARADNRQSQRDAMSDMTSIAGGDWRTASGTADRNAAIDLKSNLESIGRYAHDRASKAALADAYTKEYLNQVSGIPAVVNEGLRGEEGTNQDALRGIASLGTASLNNDARLNAAEARAQALLYGWRDRADATRYAADANAGSRVGAATINANRPRVDTAAVHGMFQTANGLINNGMSVQDAYKQVGLDKYIGNGQQGQTQPAAAASKQAAPKQGDVVGGYRFNGGDPSDKDNWESVK